MDGSLFDRAGEVFLDLCELGADEREAPVDEQAPIAPELSAALAALPEGQREAVSLIQVEGLSVAEAALRVGISAGALKVRAHRGYRAMRKALEGMRENGEWRSERPPQSRDKSGTGGGQ